MRTKLVLAMAALAALAACGEKSASQATSGEKSASQATSAAPEPPPFPTFTVSEIVAMNKNQRDELERRCLGLKNTTCDNLKSDQFKTSFELNVSLCKSKAAYEALMSPHRAAEARKKCEEM